MTQEITIKNTKNMIAIGILKGKTTLHCSICGDPSRRTIKAYVYDKNDLDTPSKEITDRINKLKAKEYTCRICKSIVKSSDEYAAEEAAK